MSDRALPNRTASLHNSKPTTWLNTVLPGRRLRLALALLALGLVVATLSLRTLRYLNIAGKPDAQHWALQDFRDAVYYPVVAMLEGANPYDTPGYMARYPVHQLFPLYSPLTLLVHLPFGLLPYTWSEALYFTTTIGLTVLLAWMALRIAGQRPEPSVVIALAALILISRPGHMNLLIGQVTLPVVLASVAALHWGRRRPYLAGVALAIATLKPTYGAPLMLLMLARQNYRAAAVGAIGGGLGALAGLAVISWHSGGIAGVIAAIPANYATFEAQGTVDLASSWARLDVVATVSRCLGSEPGTTAQLLLSIGVLVLAAAIVRRLSNSVDSHRADGITAAVVCLAVLICCYHQAYDLLLLVVPCVALAFAAQPWWNRISRRLRWTLLLLLIIPFANYAATRSIIDRFDLTGPAWTFVTSINGLALLGAFGLCAYVARRRPEQIDRMHGHAQLESPGPDPTTPGLQNACDRSGVVSGDAPRVSLGLPVFNGERFLAKTLDALLAQTYTDFELIISDNGSTDQTPQICEQYARRDGRIRYIRQSENRGAAWNFNHVFHLARGRYFKWAAHDDICRPSFLEHCVASLDADPGVVLCYARYGVIDEHDRVYTDIEAALLLGGQRPNSAVDNSARRTRLASSRPADRYEGVLLQSAWVFEIFGLIRTDALRRTGLHRPYYGSDKTLLAELSLMGRFHEVPELLFFSRRHDNQSASIPAAHGRDLWMNPRASRWLSRWIRLRTAWGHLMAAVRIPLPLRERFSCFIAFGRYCLQWKKWKRLLLARE